MTPVLESRGPVGGERNPEVCPVDLFLDDHRDALNPRIRVARCHDKVITSNATSTSVEKVVSPRKLQNSRFDGDRFGSVSPKKILSFAVRTN
eukprot:CAMPEP_0172604446 /NCGR_PEP_ID=MMETSP1068-20121228/24696_1 /TAXON_ID=35684 /ORGANISM="Pseudopedinella elastica, Strain CCMP716" /LENGTH=91 /DNA_ID=CAMNT_0013406513 /DNA_START=554 /DNA_END=829 /DNA_ORIENTATION=+